MPNYADIISGSEKCLLVETECIITAQSHPWPLISVAVDNDMHSINSGPVLSRIVDTARFPLKQPLFAYIRPKIWECFLCSRSPISRLRSAKIQNSGQIILHLITFEVTQHIYRPMTVRYSNATEAWAVRRLASLT